MSGFKDICKSLGVAAGIGTLSGVVAGGIGAGLSAASGAAGAAILQSYNYDGYNVSDAANIGAAGGAIIGGSVGFFAGILSMLDVNILTKNSNTTALAIAAANVINGLVGYGVLQSTGSDIEMPLGQTAASFAVGACVTLIPLAILGSCSKSNEEQERPRPRV